MIYDGKYSVTFIVDDVEKNTWEDWCLAPSSRPVIAPPEIADFSFEIDGRDGKVDFSDDIFAEHPLSNRVGALDFYIDHTNEKYFSWNSTYDEIMNFLHGKNGKIVLSDEPYSYYKGRFTVKDFKSNPDWSVISIGYDLYPYKMGLISRAFAMRDDASKTAIAVSRTIDDYTFEISVGNSISATIADILEDNAYIEKISVTPLKSVSKDTYVDFGFSRYTNAGYFVSDSFSILIENGDVKTYDFAYNQTLYKKYDQFYFTYQGTHNSTEKPNIMVKITFRSATL